MKDYIDYMNDITVTADLHRKIIERTTAKPKSIINIQEIRRYAAPMTIAAACIIVVGITIFTIPQLLGAPDRNASDGSRDSMKFEPSESFRTGDTAPLDEEQSGYAILTLEQARSDGDFGAYISVNVPAQFSFDSAQKSTGNVDKSLSVLWKDAQSSSDVSITWTVTMSAADKQDHIVYAHEREKYDTTLYSLPWEASVPKELQKIFEDPVFLSEELTLETILARSYHSDDDLRDSPGLRMNFSVLYGDVVVLVNTKGATPEQLFIMLMELSDPEASHKSFDKTDTWVSADDN